MKISEGTIDEQLELLIGLLNLLETEKGREEKEFEGFTSVIEKIIKKPLSDQQRIKLLEVIIEYIQSEEATEARHIAINKVLTLPELLTKLG